MKFRQCEAVRRPSDTVPPNPANDASCESVEKTGSMTGWKTVYDDDGHGFGGGTSGDDLRRLETIVGGHHYDFVLDNQYIDNETDLTNTLMNMKEQQGFPAIAVVGPHTAALKNDYLKRHPEETDIPDKSTPHALKVEGVNEDGTVHVFKPWGGTIDLSVHDLYLAIKGSKIN